MIFLIDHNLKGHAVILLGAILFETAKPIASQGWLDIVPIQFVTFDEMDLPIDSDDRVVWRLAQANQIILQSVNCSRQWVDAPPPRQHQRFADC